MEKQANYRWGRCIFVLIILGLGSFFWCRYFPKLCPWGSGTGSCPEPEAQLIIEDPYIAAWMAFDNHFIVEDLGDNNAADDDGVPYQAHTCEGGTDLQKYGDCNGYTDETRTGVMIQIGKAVTDPEFDYTGDYFKHVVLAFNDSSKPDVWLGQAAIPGTSNYPDTAAFDWLDILPVSTDPATDDPICAIDSFHAYPLFQNGVIRTECERTGKTFPYVESSGSSRPTILGDKPLDDSCYRNRAIHAGLDPNYALITYWAGANFYSIHATDDDAIGDDHVEHTFDLQDSVVVEHWYQGCYVGRYTDIAEIRLVIDSTVTPHQGIGDPPTNGGHITYPP